MAKTAAIGVRVDEELKVEAQKVFDDMGLPMSLAVEMFLRQVVANGKLPFAIESSEVEDAERKERIRDLWKSFIVWYFKVWPSFNSPEIEERARRELGYTGDGAGWIASEYISGDTGGSSGKKAPDQLRASIDLSHALGLLSEAKELIYWALSFSPDIFVPSLSAEYGAEADVWRFNYLKQKNEPFDLDEATIASGVIQDRYFAEYGEEDAGL